MKSSNLLLLVVLLACSSTEILFAQMTWYPYARRYPYAGWYAVGSPVPPYDISRRSDKFLVWVCSDTTENEQDAIENVTTCVFAELFNELTDLIEEERELNIEMLLLLHEISQADSMITANPPLVSEIEKKPKVSYRAYLSFSISLKLLKDNLIKCAKQTDRGMAANLEALIEALNSLLTYQHGSLLSFDYGILLSGGHAASSFISPHYSSHLPGMYIREARRWEDRPSVFSPDPLGGLRLGFFSFPELDTLPPFDWNGSINQSDENMLQTSSDSSSNKASSRKLKYEQIDEIIKNLDNAHIAFTAPDTMLLNENWQVFLLMSRGLSSSQLASKIPLLVSDSSKIGRIFKETVKVDEQMEAHLNGQGFSIKAITETRQLVLTEGETRWEWQITAEKAGMVTLFLTLNAVIHYKGDQIILTIETYRRNIYVYVKTKNKIFSWFNRNIAWISGIICSIVTLFLGYFLANMRENRKIAEETKKDKKIIIP